MRSCCLILVLGAALSPAAESADAHRTPDLVEPCDDGRGTPFIVLKSDNICGLDEPRQLATPARVDYDVLLEETPEVKEIRRDKIDITSSKGITLMTKARSRVLKACESVRIDNGYDSIWKSITRRDHRAVPDVTETVKSKLGVSGSAGQPAAPAIAAGH